MPCLLSGCSPIIFKRVENRSLTAGPKQIPERGMRVHIHIQQTGAEVVFEDRNQKGVHLGSAVAAVVDRPADLSWSNT